MAQGVSRRPRGWAQLGGRSPGLRLAAAVFRPWKATQYNPGGATARGRASAPYPPIARNGSPPCHGLIRQDWLRRVRTENTNCSDQPLNGQGSVAPVFTPPPLETQRPWGAQLPLRVGCSTQPSEKPLGRRLFF